MGAGKVVKGVLGDKGSKFLTVGTAMNLGFGYMDYKDAREQGHSRIGATASAAATFAVGEVIGWGMIPLALAQSVPQLAVAGIEGIGKMQRQMNMDGRRIPFANSKFNDFNQAVTMRQAGMQLAKNSQYNLQQSLMGNEASMLR